jgi:protocatechuate 3,4-dioxygenase beta subunit
MAHAGQCTALIVIVTVQHRKGAMRTLTPRVRFVALILSVIAGGGFAISSGVAASSSKARASAPRGQRQLPPTGSAALVGRVIDAETGAGLGGATVVLRPFGSGFAVSTVFATDAGEFTFGGLGRAQYTLLARHAGYLDGSYGQEFPDELETPIDLDGSNRVADLVVPLWRLASIAGTVVDQKGAPLVSVDVLAVARTFTSGRTTFQPVARATTDDRGAYRMATLSAGHYMVALSATTTRPTVFFPDAASGADAEVFALSSGAEPAGVDFHVTTKDVPRGSIHGRLVGALAGAPVTLLATEGDAFVNVPLMRTQTDASGAYGFTSVRPGDYVVRAVVNSYRLMRPTSGSLGNAVAEAHVAVAQTDVIAPTMNLAAVALSGQVVFRGEAPRPAMSNLELYVSRADGRGLAPTPFPSRFPVGSDGTFSATGLAPGKYDVAVDGQLGAGHAPAVTIQRIQYIVSPTAPSGAWRTQEVTIQGRPAPNDVIDVGPFGASDVVVVMADVSRPMLSGTVVDENGQPRTSASVYLIPSDVGLWENFGLSFRFQTHRSGAAGRYAFQAPAGDYLVTATTSDIAGGFWMGRPVFDALKKIAVSLHLTDGESVTRELRVTKTPSWQ